MNAGSQKRSLTADDNASAATTAELDSPRSPDFTASQREALVDIHSYSLDVLSKKYDLYDWCETKINTLVTVDGILLGALVLLFGGDKFALKGAINLGLATAAALLFTASLGFSLYHVDPKMWSGRITDQKNLRTVKGTENYQSNEEYIKAMMALDLQSMIRVNCHQIRGMNANIWKNYRAIRFAVVTTIGGLLAMLAMFGRAYL